MKTFTQLTACVCFSFIANSVLAAQPEKPVIQKVIDIPKAASVCGVTKTRMIYLDAEGKRSQMDYLTFGDGCNG